MINSNSVDFYLRGFRDYIDEPICSNLRGLERNFSSQACDTFN